MNNNYYRIAYIFFGLVMLILAILLLTIGINRQTDSPKKVVPTATPSATLAPLRNTTIIDTSSGRTIVPTPIIIENKTVEKETKTETKTETKESPQQNDIGQTVQDVVKSLFE